MTDLLKITEALIAGANYYGVFYPTGIQIIAEGGSNIVYDHACNIVTSSTDRAALDKIVARAKTAATKKLA